MGGRWGQQMVGGGEVRPKNKNGGEVRRPGPHPSRWQQRGGPGKCPAVNPLQTSKSI
jgi:hypothetical protein